MAFTGDLGRVQGASMFHTSAASGVTVQISSLQPQLTPFVGDAVLFPNGDVRQIIGVSGSTVTLGSVLYSVKGDPGIGNATLSNTDGDSTENGSTQAAIKGVMQAKNYYNLGAYDTFVSNGDGTGTVTRKTRLINAKELVWGYAGDELGTWAANPPFSISPNHPIRATNYFVSQKPYTELPIGAISTNWTNYSGSSKIIVKSSNKPTGYIEMLDLDIYQYTEQVIENQPIRLANQEEEWDWHEEWRKGLNLYKGNGYYDVDYGNNHKHFVVMRLPVGQYTINIVNAVITSESTSAGGIYIDGRLKGLWEGKNFLTFYNDKENAQCAVDIYNPPTGNLQIMLVKGAYPYPYGDYYGKILHEKDLSGVQLFPEGVNPAQTIGGDWEDKGTVTTSDNTVFHAYKRL